MCTSSSKGLLPRGDGQALSVLSENFFSNELDGELPNPQINRQFPTLLEHPCILLSVSPCLPYLIFLYKPLNGHQIITISSTTFHFLLVLTLTYTVVPDVVFPGMELHFNEISTEKFSHNDSYI